MVAMVVAMVMMVVVHMQVFLPHPHGPHGHAPCIHGWAAAWTSVPMIASSIGWASNVDEVVMVRVAMMVVMIPLHHSLHNALPSHQRAWIVGRQHCIGGYHVGRQDPLPPHLRVGEEQGSWIDPRGMHACVHMSQGRVLACSNHHLGWQSLFWYDVLRLIFNGSSTSS